MNQTQVSIRIGYNRNLIEDNNSKGDTFTKKKKESSKESE